MPPVQVMDADNGDIAEEQSSSFARQTDNAVAATATVGCSATTCCQSTPAPWCQKALRIVAREPYLSNRAEASAIGVHLHEEVLFAEPFQSQINADGGGHRSVA